MRASFAAWVAVAALLAAALAWRAADAHRANAALYRRLCETEAELARQEAERERLRAELEALENDPMYVETLLRRVRLVEPGELLIEGK